MRRALKWIALGLVLTLVGSWLLFPGLRVFCHAFWDTERVPFTISRETTRITEPILPDGRVDYAAALNARLSQGVTLDNNAAAAFWQARGSKDLDDNPDAWARVEKLWGNGPIPPSEHVFVTERQFAEELWQRAGRPEDENRQPAAFAKKLDANREQAMLRPWSAEEYPDVAECLARNDAALGKMADAMRRPHFYLPIVGNSESFLVRALVVWDVAAFREYVRWLVARTMLRVRQGRVDDAWNDILTTERMARLFAQRNTLVHQLIGWAFSGIANGQCGVALAAEGNLSAQTTARMLHDIRDLPAYPPLADAIDRSERYVCLDIFCTVARYGPEIDEADIAAGVRKDSTKRLVGRARRAALHACCDWDVMLRDFNGVYDKLTRVFQADSRVQRKTREREYLAHLKDLGLDLDGPRPLADWTGLPSRQDKLLKAFLSLVLPSHKGVLDAYDGHEARLRLLPLALALAGYKADHREFPTKLAELVPKYFDKLPKDPFTDADFLYRREGSGYLLYSVGRNEKDDGGRTSEDDPNCDDIAVRVPIPPPKEEKEQ